MFISNPLQLIEQIFMSLELTTWESYYINFKRIGKRKKNVEITHSSVINKAEFSLTTYLQHFNLTVFKFEFNFKEGAGRYLQF